MGKKDQGQKVELHTPSLLQAFSVEGAYQDGQRLSSFLRMKYMGAAEYEFGSVPTALRALAERAKKLQVFKIDLARVTPARAWKRGYGEKGPITFEKVSGKGEPARYQSENCRFRITKLDGGGWSLTQVGCEVAKVLPSLAAAKKQATEDQKVWEAAWQPVKAVYLVAAASEVETYSEWLRALAGETQNRPRIKQGCYLSDWVNGDLRKDDGDLSKPEAWLDLGNKVAFAVSEEVATNLLKCLPVTLAYMNEQRAKNEAEQKVAAQKTVGARRATR